MMDDAPKDDYMQYFTFCKVEGKKILVHTKFEDVVQKYWQLLRVQDGCDLEKLSVTKEQYTNLMKLIYKVLLPIYREKEMASEIDQEWLMDSVGNAELSLHLFSKVLFRIAHQWATHVDLDEYCELLMKIFKRITVRRVIKSSDGSVIEAMPTLVVEIVTPPVDEGIDDPFRSSEQEELAMWEACQSDEEEKDEFDYHYFEQADTLTVKKHKKRKLLLEGKDNAMEQEHVPMFPAKEPIKYREEVVYHQNNGDYRPLSDDFVSYALADFKDVFPFGYATEQFFTWMKNDVTAKFEASKKARKEALAKLKREAQEGKTTIKESQIEKEKDTGMIQMSGKTVHLPFEMKTTEPSKVRSKAKLVDTLYNSLRQVQMHSERLSLRIEMEHPKKSVIETREKSKAPVGGSEPVLEINKVGYNPALERRIAYKRLPMYSQDDKPCWMNINYLLYHHDYETAHRCDVERYENAEKLNIKKADKSTGRIEDFVNIETSYKKTRQNMLRKKFESLYQETLNADESEAKRIDKVADREKARVAQVRNPEPLNLKNVHETLQDKSAQDIKVVKGPYYQLITKDGIGEDDFVNCPQQDLLNYAKQEACRILILGKPRAGKTTISKILSKRLDLVHVNLENWLLKLQDKVKNYEAPEEEPEEGQTIPDFLSPLERSVWNKLQVGQGPSHEETLQVLKDECSSNLAKTKGFILDLTFYQAPEEWAKCIRNYNIIGEPDAEGNNPNFTHILDLDMDDDEVRLRAEHMRLDPTDGVVYSAWEIKERNKPKPIKYDEDGNPIEEEEEEDENAPKKLDVDSLVHRVEDTPDMIQRELINYNSEHKSMIAYVQKLHLSQYIKLDIAGLTPETIADSCEWRIRSDSTIPLRPVPKQLEGAGDMKALLTEPLFEDQPEGTLARQWSLWKQIDPVALFKQQLIPGQAEFAVAYANNMFVFANEENMKAFIAEPKKYLQSEPKMPSNFRIMIAGPKGIGCHTQAAALSDIYGWKVIDYQQLVKSRLQKIIKRDHHIPNNVVPNSSEVGLSEEEIAEIKTGKPFPSWKFIPWILDELKMPLMQRPPPPPPEEGEGQEAPAEEELTDEQKAEAEKARKKKEAEDAKKAKEAEEAAKAKEDRRKRRQDAIAAGKDPVDMGIEDSEDEKIPDLSIDNIILKPGADGKIPHVGGFILLGFPQTDLHAQKLKEAGIDFDRIISLADTSEEEPGKTIQARMVKNDMHYNYEVENEKAQKILNAAKEVLGEGKEENFMATVMGVGDMAVVTHQIRLEIDPFFLRVDNPDDVRVSADLGEEDKRLPKGDFGDYCPVSYVNFGFMQKGNPELECTIFGKTYIFAGEKEQEEFKANPKKFLIAQNGKAELPLAPPAPKIMVLGMKGAGITTQINMLCDRYKLESFNLKDEFLKKLKSEKEIRKRRRLLDRGFRPPLPAEEEGEAPPPDPEIEDDPEDFDKEGHEREILRMILDANKGLIIDGTWNGFPEETVLAVDGAGFANLLIEARVAPELVVILKCKEGPAFDRLIDSKAIKEEFNRLMKERAEAKQKRREEDRAAKLQELTDALKDDEEKSPEDKEAEIQDGIAKWDEERDAEEEAAEEDDPEKPNEEEMLEKQREAIRTQREADEGFLEEFAGALQERGIVVINDLTSDLSASFVHTKLNARLTDNIQKRPDMIERQQAQPLTEKELPFYEQSYQYKQSKFGRNSPLNISSPSKSRQFAVLYRERIYYLGSKEEQTAFLSEPSKYTKGVDAVPLDVRNVPQVCVLGLPKSGKTELCKRIAERTGAIHLQMDQIIQQYIENDSVECARLRKEMKREGRGIEESIIQLLKKRTQQRDCLEKGWVLEDFPKTKFHADLMAREGIKPQNVIFIRISNEEVYNRTAAQAADAFECNRSIIAHRLRYYESTMPQVLGFYTRMYNSLTEIDGTLSKWYMEDRAISTIHANLHSRHQFAKNLYLERPCEIQDLHYDKNLAKANLSMYGYFCPVTWKNTKQLVKCVHDQENVVYFQNVFFYFKSALERSMFVGNPDRFLNNVIFCKPKSIPLRFKLHKAAEICSDSSSSDKYIMSHCPVTLVDESRVVKGDQLLLVTYKETKFVFESEYKLQKFLMTPGRYNKVELPVKMPPHEDPVNLFALRAGADSTTFIEQALGSIVTRGLREVSENRLKYPNISVKETMLKLFALYLKAENSANTEFMRDKYRARMKQFVERCELAEELEDLAQEKEEKLKEGKWPDFKEKFLKELGAKYDSVLEESIQEKANGFANYLK